jgi:hypothetical protein
MKAQLAQYKNPRQHLKDRFNYLRKNDKEYVIETRRQMHRIYHLMHPVRQRGRNSKPDASSSLSKSDDDRMNSDEEGEEEWRFEEDLPQELEEYEEYLSPVGSLQSEDWANLNAAFEEAHILGDSAAAAASSSSSSKSKRAKRDKETWQDYLWLMSAQDEDI